MRYTLFAFALLASVAGPSMGDTLLVKSDGTGDFATIQAAVDACVDGDIIELEDGTFTGDGNRDVSYLGRAITVRSQSGNPDSCIIDCEGSETEPHRGFDFLNGEGSGSVLERVSIVNGYGHPWGGYPSVGGGIIIDGASPTIRGCKVSECYAYAGGGIALMGSPTIDACTFSNNLSTIGGGVAVGTDATPILTDCTFEGNTADTWGGGLSCISALATLMDCSFKNNHAASGGAINARVEGTEIVSTNCTFEGNTASSTGGGVAAIESSSAIVTGCTFGGNSASTGGAISCTGGAALTLTGSTLYGNDGPSASGLIFSTASPCAIDNSIIAFGTGGPAMTGTGTPPTLTCSDIYGNEGGDWVGYIADQYGVDGNISEDPLFCDAENDDFSLDSDSPCLPSNHPDGAGACGLIGSHGIGCGTADVDETVGLEGDRLYLAPGSPNPFASSSRITYAIPGAADVSRVRLNIYNAEGQVVRTLVNAPQAAGMHHVTWDGTTDTGISAAGGVYFYQLVLNGETQTRRIILVR